MNTIRDKVGLVLGIVNALALCFVAVAVLMLAQREVVVQLPPVEEPDEQIIVEIEFLATDYLQFGINTRDVGTLARTVCPPEHPDYFALVDTLRAHSLLTGDRDCFVYTLAHRVSTGIYQFQMDVYADFEAYENGNKLGQVTRAQLAMIRIDKQTYIQSADLVALLDDTFALIST